MFRILSLVAVWHAREAVPEYHLKLTARCCPVSIRYNTPNLHNYSIIQLFIFLILQMSEL